MKDHKLGHIFIGLLMLLNEALWASPLNLSSVPLFTGGTVAPNVVFQVDDSGSMDWDILTKTHWQFCAYNPNAGTGYSSTDCGAEQADGSIRSYKSGYKDFTYVFSNADNLYSTNCGSSDINAFGDCSSAAAFEWRQYSSDLNVTYFDPDQSYEAWAGRCSGTTACANASFSAARANPRSGSSGYTVTTNLAGSEYHVWLDNKGYTGARPRRGVNLNVTSTPNGEVDLWDSHTRIVLNAANAVIQSIDYVPTTLSLGAVTVTRATLTSTTACYNVLGGSDLVRSIMNGSLGWTSTDGVGCKTLPQAQQNFANWFQYNRKRSQIAKYALSKVVRQYPFFRYGLNLINVTTPFIQVPPASATDFTSYNNTLLDTLYDYDWQPNGTPLRTGLERVGKYFDGALSGTTDPIISSCQQNFAILITDGYWNGSDPSSTIGNADGDPYNKTLADVARYYYTRDLSTLPNNVMPNSFDPATHQHMVTFTVAFGLTGNLVDTDNDGWPNPMLSENSDWGGNPYTSDLAKIDDLWHAAYNSRGGFISAGNPSALASGLSNALSNITTRISSASSATQNSSILQTSSLVFQAQFDGSTWAGKLLAYPISTTGVISTTPTWEAGCVLTGGTCTLPAGSNTGITPTNRVIITSNWNENRQGAAFRFPSNYTTLKSGGTYPARFTSYMAGAPYPITTTNAAQIAANQTYGQNLTNYLRGERNNEIRNGGTMRNRDSILGDIVNSSPLYVGAPSRVYPDTLQTNPYSTFKSTYASRTPMVYVGSNDGMMHGFQASNGVEKLAYVPGNKLIYSRLPALINPNYTHNYLVDGDVTEGDVYINNAWKTVLIGSLRNGGQGIYALDITNPATFTESNASSIMLWEFNDPDDPDLGFTHSPISIAKMANGKWAAIFGNGFNNTNADGSVSTTGRAALYIVFIENGVNGATWVSGTDYIKIPVGPTNTTTPNGLTGAYVVDINADYVADYIYAGDLKGNLWKFDVRSSTPSSWASATTNNLTPFFVAQQTAAGDQPITANPIVGPHPKGLSYGLMIYFGTGKYLEATDNSGIGQTTQSFYAVWDRLNGTLPLKSNLLQQTITNEVSQAFDTNGDGIVDTTYQARVTSQNAINWNTPNQNDGWYMNLILQGASSNNGERHVAGAILRNNRIIFPTLLPSPSPCAFGGESWLMELDASNGAGLSVSPFDFQLSGQFNSGDLITIGTNADGSPIQRAASGMKSTVGIISKPSVVVAADKKSEYKVMSGSTGLSAMGENPGTEALGRQSWRQLK